MKLKDLPRATTSALREPHAGATEEYMNRFAQPSDIDKPLRLKCKRELFYSFRWGLAHGEENCTGCGWPTRLYHYFKIEDGTETRRVQFLQYHPTLVTRRKSS